MKHFIIAFLLIFSGSSFSQEESIVVNFDEYVGWNVDGMTGLQFGYHPGNGEPAIYTFGLYPRYNFFAPTEWFSISAGAPLQMGLDFLTFNSDLFVSFAADIPATIDINIGARSTTYNESLVGAFIGGGINYNYSYFLAGDNKLRSHAFGPIVHGGFRWTYYGRPLGVRAAYLWGLANNVEQDPFILFEGPTYPRFLSVSLLVGLK